MKTGILYRVLLFSFLFFFAVSCASQHAQTDNNDFYLGLLIDASDAEKRPERIKLFENALLSSNVYARQAAAEQLALLMVQGAELSSGTINLLKSEASSWWGEAFSLIGSGDSSLNRDSAQLKQRVLSFLLESAQDTSYSYGEARSYILKECGRHHVYFSDEEYAAIEARYAITHLRYNDALRFFRVFMVSPQDVNVSANRIWPQDMPRFFLRYPNLINDLGRAFQYTQAGIEGVNLFLQWESNLRDATGSISEDEIRYRLIFYAARIARRTGQSVQALSLFDRALSLAPDNEQNDACIWYLMDLSLTGNLNTAMERLEKYIPYLCNGNYINDLMESFLHRLVSAQDWTRIITAYRIIKDTNDYGLKAGFAWVIARAIQEGYLSQANMSAAAQIINSQTAGSDDFFHLAYNAGDVFLIPALYYRVQSAKALDLPVLIFPDNPDNESATDTELLRFILGFFENGAADFSIPYIRFHENSMSPDELRETASALDEAENYPQSIRVVSLYVNNEGYQRTRRDIELMYPRPHLELVETRAQALNTAPSLLYGLIRTESAFQSAVISHAGAVGLMQLMPDTARDMADRIRRTGGPNFFGENNVIDSTDVFTNVYIGAYYYNYLFNRFNNEQLALMSYNGGMTRVQRWVNASSLPADLLVETVTIYETRDFGRRVPAAGRVYQELYY